MSKLLWALSVIAMSLLSMAIWELSKHHGGRWLKRFESRWEENVSELRKSEHARVIAAIGATYKVLFAFPMAFAGGSAIGAAIVLVTNSWWSWLLLGVGVYISIAAVGSIVDAITMWGRVREALRLEDVEGVGNAGRL